MRWASRTASLIWSQILSVRGTQMAGGHQGGAAQPFLPEPQSLGTADSRYGAKPGAGAMAKPRLKPADSPHLVPVPGY